MKYSYNFQLQLHEDFKATVALKETQVYSLFCHFK